MKYHAILCCIMLSCYLLCIYTHVSLVKIPQPSQQKKALIGPEPAAELSAAEQLP
jgi:hypothetical protein